MRLTGKRDNAGHEKTTVHKLVIIYDDKWVVNLSHHDIISSSQVRFKELEYKLITDKLAHALPRGLRYEYMRGKSNRPNYKNRAQKG